jgi:hypothetical protein
MFTLNSFAIKPTNKKAEVFKSTLMCLSHQAVYCANQSLSFVTIKVLVYLQPRK